MTKSDKCKNGDTLEDLNRRMKSADAWLAITRYRLDQQVQRLVPFEKQVEHAEQIKMNIACRLNIWWREFGQKQQAQIP